MLKVKTIVYIILGNLLAIAAIVLTNLYLVVPWANKNFNVPIF